MLRSIAYALFFGSAFGDLVSKDENLSLNQTNYQGKTAVYWGQASAKRQNPLRYYCDSDSVDIFLISFLNDFPDSDMSKYGYELNLANACTYEESTDKSKTVPNCTSVGDDIKYCQSLNKTVLLSLGGEQGDYKFKSDEDAEDFAKVLWNSFGAGADDDFPVSDRPFGSAVIDGFDFDLENEDQTGLVTLAKKLQDFATKDDSKKYSFTAAPQCVFPDLSMSELIEEVELDHLFIQFYNNECNLNQKFNFEIWAQHVESLQHNNIDIFIGLPANEKAAPMGFAKKEVILDRVKQIHEDELMKSKFGGFMFWDASQGFGYGDYQSFETNLITDVASCLDRGQVHVRDSGVVVEEGPLFVSNSTNESISDNLDRIDIAFLVIAFVFSTLIITGF